MKRASFLILSLALSAMLLAGCGAGQGTAASAAPSSAAASVSSPASDAASEAAPAQAGADGLANPITVQDSLAAVNAAVGCDLERPEEFTVTDERFSTIDADVKIGQYEFTLNGAAVTVRAAATQQDISGVWQDGKTLGDFADASGKGKNYTLSADSFCWARWYDDGFQYSLYAEGLDQQTFNALQDDLD